MNKRLIAVAASIIAVGGITFAIAGGSFQTLPIVSELAFCGSTVTGVGSSNAPYLVPPGSTQGTSISSCGQVIPAGPPGLTGNEIFPADVSTVTTSPTFQGQPTTVAIPIILTDSGAYTYSVPNATRANFTVSNPTNWLILDGTATAFAQINVQLPGTVAQPALNGQQFHITSTTSITVLGIVGQSGTTVQQAPTTLVTNSGSFQPPSVAFIYDSTISTWFRTQ